MNLNFFKNPETGKVDLFWTVSVLVLAAYSAFAYLWQLAAGQRSEFYAAIAVSMSKSWSNWWWGAADPAGTITLDKIPGSYWIPAAFVKLFGFSTWAVNAPNALASIALVLVVAATGRRLAGRVGGLIAGAIAATTPILAAVGRSNQPETFFLLWMAVAAYFAVRALQANSFKFLMLAGVFIAVAFQSYMLVAWAAWPALGLAWLLTNQTWQRKIGTLLAAGLSSLGLSLVWVVSVALTPAGARPYIGGSNTNSGFEMVFGYNGLGRFSTFTSGTASSSVRSFTPPFSGDPGFFRLVNSQLLPQIGWLIPAAFIAAGVVLLARKVGAVGWFVISFFLVYAAMFSVVSGMHQFYTAQLAIGIALLVAHAFGRALDTGDRIGPVLIVASAAFTSLYIAVQYSSYLLWAPVVQFAVAIAAVVLIILRTDGPARTVSAVATTLALVLAPAFWSADVYNYPSSINPVAGPSNVMGTVGGGGIGAQAPGGGFSGGGFGAPGGGMGGFGGLSSTDSGLIKYLTAHRGNAKFLVAVFGTMTAAPYITKTGENILPIGGFDGADPSPTLAQIKSFVAGGQLKYVLIGGQGQGQGMGNGGGPNSGGSGSANSVGSANGNSIQTWVEANCQVAGYSGASLYRCVPSSVK